MPITCADIFANIEHEVMGNPLVPISGIAFDSRAVQPGDAFFCVVGTESDGHAFAQAAVDAGASVIVCQHQPELADPPAVTQVRVEDARRALAEAAAAFYGYPSQGMDIIGVTGTNGKTTVTYLIETMLQAAHHPCGVIGTCGSRACGNPIPSLHTTPESADLQRILALMRSAGCQAVAMEVSSHALSLGRPWATRFAVTAFTNITHDHLDYHHTLEEYFEAKKLLFSEEYPAIRVISTFGEGGRALEAACREAGDEVIAVGERPEDDIRLVSSQRVGGATQLTLQLSGRFAPVGQLVITHGLLGSFNTENILVALGCVLALDVDAHQAAAALAEASAPPGRMQQAVVKPDLGFAVYVDYAHTPDALEKVILSAKEAASGRVALVFGCEGDRDRLKRPEMAQAALLADDVFLTNDNAHGERVTAVIEEVRAALPTDDARIRTIPDRKAAIRAAVDHAEPGDIVLICGRGHEDKMMFGADTVHFDDREEARYALLMRAVMDGVEMR